MSAHSEKELHAQIKQLTDQNSSQGIINKNLTSKVLNLEKELQAEKKRRAEAEKKLADSVPDSRAFANGQFASEQEELQRVKEVINHVSNRLKK
jgi:predicted  nucleic acid-binding Zn-ribbon protein